MGTQMQLELQDVTISEADLARELELEEEGIQAGVTQYRKIVEESKEGWRINKEGKRVWRAGKETTTTPGQRLLKATIEPTEKAILKWVEEANTGRPGRRHSAAYALSSLDPAVILSLIHI